MWRRALAAVALLVFHVASVPAAITFSAAGVPAVGLPGIGAYTFTAKAAPDEKIVGFDFVGGGGAYGISGQFHQLSPFGLATIFADNNAIFPFIDADVTQDTQFTNKTADGLAFLASESANSLKAAFAMLPASVATATNEWPFVQLVIDPVSNFSLNGTLTVRNLGGNDQLEAVSYFPALIGLPYFYESVIDNVIAEGPGIVNSPIQLPPFSTSTTLSNLRLGSYVPAPGVTGSGPAIAATLSGSLFNWDTHGSPPGTYK